MPKHTSQLHTRAKEASGALFSTILDAAHDAIIAIDQNQNIILFNQGAKRIFGYNAAEVIDQPLDILLPASLAQIHRAHVREFAESATDTRIMGERREISVWRKDGRLFPAEASIAKVSNGEQTIFLVILRDITERKPAEEVLGDTLKESQQRQAEISALLQGSRAVLKHREFKDAAHSIFDFCKNLIGATGGYVALLTPDGIENEVLFLDSGGHACTVDRSLPMPIRGLRGEAYRTGKAVYHNDFANSEWVKYVPEGHVALDNILFAPLVIEGKTVGLLGLANKPGGFTKNDVRIASAFGELAAIALLNSRTVEALEHSEERFRAVAQSASDAIISLDSQGVIVFWNNAAQAIFGWPAEEIIGKPVTEIMPEHYRADHQAGMQRLITTGEAHVVGRTVELTGLRKDGTEFPIELSLSSWQTREGVFFTSIIRDITARKRVEEEIRKLNAGLEQRVIKRTAQLRESETKYRIVADNTYDWEFWLDSEGQFIYISPSCERITGHTPEEFATDPGLLLRIVHPDDRPRWNEHHCKTTQGKITEEIEFRVLRSDGTARWIGHACQPVFDDAGRFIGTRGSNRDITKRRQAQEALRESEEHFRALIENNWDLIGVVDEGSLICYIAPSVERLLGYRLEEILGQPMLDFIHPDDMGRAAEALAQRVQQPGVADAYIEVRLRHKDGSWRVLEGIGTNLLDNPAVGGIVINARDITERKRAEEERARLYEQVCTANERLRQLTQQVVFAQEEERQRISHELHDEAGQALTALRITLELVQGELPANLSVVRQRLSDCIRLIDTTSERVHLLAQNLRPPGLDAVGLGPTLEGYCLGFTGLTQLSIDYVGTDVPALPETVTISLYRFLQEALTNVVKHAHARHVKVALHVDADAIRLSVEDDGRGFAVQSAQVVSSRSKGLGLIGMQERLEALGGRVEIVSQPGQGTRLIAVYPGRSSHDSRDSR